MRRLGLGFILLVVCTMASSQSKLTTHALLHINKEKAVKAHRPLQANAMDGYSQLSGAAHEMRLIVKVKDEQAVATYKQMRQAGAKILARLDQQAVISLPVDSIDALAKIEGVIRIDVGRRAQKKTNITRMETNVNQIDGTSFKPKYSYTGKGVNVVVLDAGFDFQHKAFKDSLDQSRIKAVYLIDKEDGHNFTVNDPVAGLIEFPGSIYDTPELIATLTTDNPTEAHGTHTAAIAAGTRSPQGYGGMAPEANIVLVPIPDSPEEEDITSISGLYSAFASMETAIMFAAAYARQSEQPTVLSMSANAHFGPHDGTGTIPEAIEAVSTDLIPVLSVGNEGADKIHVFKQFTATDSIARLILPFMENKLETLVTGHLRYGDSLSIQISLYNPETQQTLWQTNKLISTDNNELEELYCKSEEDDRLAPHFEGEVVLLVSKENGKQVVYGGALGELKDECILFISAKGSEGTAVDFWEQTGLGFPNYDLEGFEIGDNEMSAGDWSSTPSVISVGAYCGNTTVCDYDSEPFRAVNYQIQKGKSVGFSSYGTMLNGVIQPVVCAPGVFVVSAWSRFVIGEDETVLDNMQWDGCPYTESSGTSMSCPVVSGIIALWLQANPNLTTTDIIELLRETSRNDKNTQSSQKRFGFGKIDALKGLEYALAAAGIHEINATQSPHNDYIYDLQGRRVTHITQPGLYIQNGRKFLNTDK